MSVHCPINIFYVSRLTIQSYDQISASLSLVLNLDAHISLNASNFLISAVLFLSLLSVHCSLSHGSTLKGELCRLLSCLSLQLRGLIFGKCNGGTFLLRKFKMAAPSCFEFGSIRGSRAALRLTSSGGSFKFRVNLNKRAEMNSTALCSSSCCRPSRVCPSEGGCTEVVVDGEEVLMKKKNAKSCRLTSLWDVLLSHLFKWKECGEALVLRGWCGMQFAA